MRQHKEGDDANPSLRSRKALADETGMASADKNTKSGRRLHFIPVVGNGLADESELIQGMGKQKEGGDPNPPLRS